MSAFTVHFMCSCQAVAEHFEQCAEFPTLRIQNPLPSHASTEGREVKQSLPRNRR
jgi:hypothetical protein